MVRVAHPQRSTALVYIVLMGLLVAALAGVAGLPFFPSLILATGLAGAATAVVASRVGRLRGSDGGERGGDQEPKSNA
jgi:Kef-type K+ transport system membrane component KefB